MSSTSFHSESAERGSTAPVAVLSFALVLVLAAPVVVITIGLNHATPPASLNATLLAGMLAGAALVGLTAAGSMSILRYRLIGDSVSLAVGLGLVLIGLFLVGAGLVPALSVKLNYLSG